MTQDVKRNNGFKMTVSSFDKIRDTTRFEKHLAVASKCWQIRVAIQQTAMFESLGEARLGYKTAVLIMRLDNS